MTQLSLGEELRDEGIEATAKDNEQWLRWIRREAVKLSAKHGRVSSSDLRKIADAAKFQPFSENAWGAVFRVPGWEAIGWESNARASAHARAVRVWKYVGIGAHSDKGGAR